MTDRNHGANPATQSGQTSGLMIIVLLILCALVLQNGYQTYQLIDDGERLKGRIQGQEATVQDAQKVRAQLLSIAGQTAVLADGGNTNAQILIERLRAQGVTITPPATQ